MVWKNKWVMMMLNAIIGGSYIAAILLMIHWVSTGQLGMATYLIAIAVIIAMVLGWTFFGRLAKFKVTRELK